MHKKHKKHQKQTSDFHWDVLCTKKHKKHEKQTSDFHSDVFFMRVKNIKSAKSTKTSNKQLSSL